MSELPCKDCGVDTRRIHEYYMVADRIWSEANKKDTHKGFLCVSCLEKRLGRQLITDDFSNYAINWVGPKSELLINRIRSQVTFIKCWEIIHKLIDTMEEEREHIEEKMRCTSPCLSTS